MNSLRGKKFIASYSGGKDSVFAIHRAIGEGLVPLGLITTYRTDANHSWFHGFSETLLKKVSVSTSIPVRLVKTAGEKYEESFEKALMDAKTSGAEVCVFGDIDIEEHLEWCSLRCQKIGLIPYFPLWKESRKKLVYEFIDAGFSSIITIVDTRRLSEEFLGKTLSKGLVDSIEKSGADICGENGEYHTFTFNGPLFSERVAFEVVNRIKRDQYAILAIN
jgi:uncharacterized protein (TIGR00290 family)